MIPCVEEPFNIKVVLQAEGKVKKPWNSPALVQVAYVNTSKLPGQSHRGSIIAATEAQNICSSYEEMDSFE